MRGVIASLHKMAMDYCAECTEYENFGTEVLKGESDADAVRRDVALGYVSKEAARRDYGLSEDT